MELKCIECNFGFVPKNKKQIFCSDKCRVYYNRKNKNVERLDLVEFALNKLGIDRKDLFDFLLKYFFDKESIVQKMEQPAKSILKKIESVKKNENIDKIELGYTHSGLKIKRGFNYYKSIIKKIKTKEEKISINDEIVSSNDLTEEEKEKLIILAFN